MKAKRRVSQGVRIPLRSTGRAMVPVLMAVFCVGVLFSGCAATGGAAGAALGYGITGNARGAALGAGAGILAGSLYDVGAVHPAYPYAYSPAPYYGPASGRWVWAPGYWDPYGRWVPPYRYWAPY